jgi:hypothetical protein
MCANNKSHVEAWKSLIDYQKTIISLSSAVLAAIVGFYLTGKYTEVWPTIILPVLLLIVSIITACYGFGRAIKSVKTGESEPAAVSLSNWATGLLIAGILSAFSIDPKMSAGLDQIVSNIGKETSQLSDKLEPDKIESITYANKIYTLHYKTQSGTKMVTYTTEENKILEIK